MADARLRESPNSKTQAPKKPQIPMTKTSVSSDNLLELGSLELLWCLELGSWSFPHVQPTPVPFQEGSIETRTRTPVPFLGGVRGGFPRFHFRTLRLTSCHNPLHHL